uniref:NADH-ubiquinone oxidoreductase chain 4 n=1 Tax=Cassida sp. EMHAU-15090501 TaxID=2480058 RepID=A0A3G3C763_9CUCU|nr:NADH dehydrogenase subunit 4 [Cassida sp. EMHAU-15090501]
MMKFLFYLVFLMPLSFLGFNFVQVFLFYMLFMFIISSSFVSFPLMLSFSFGVDGFSYFMIILSVWVSSLMFMASWKILYLKNYEKIFSFFVLFLLFCLIMTFSSMNLFIFYVFFEVSLLPLMLIIIGWGYQPERLMAGIYLIFYTLFFSFPMMLGLFILYNKFNSFMFFELLIFDSIIVYFLINLVFFVKIPMYMIHLWLPKAHVEAPVAGSMILAGVTLKLGGYGLIRLLKLFLIMNFKFNTFFIVLSLLGSFFISLICLFQTDVKLLIAYSSVSHMGLVLSGILTLNYSGFTGSLIMMVGHGLCSSGLFCLANIYYERISSRNMYMLKGLLSIFPSFSLFMFLMSVANMSAPPSLNLLGEILLFKSLISFSSLLMFFLMLISFFSAVYCVYLFSYSNHGKFYSGYYCFHVGYIREFLLLFLHLFPLNFIVFMSDLFNVF